MSRILPRSEEVSLYSRLKWKEALALVGPRRAGKSTMARRLLEAWQAQGGKGVYLDLEAVGAPSSLAGLDEACKAVPNGGLLVLDEMQEVDGWERWVRREVEYEKRHVLVTGSSASLLSAEIANSLGGRAVPQKLLPLSFSDARAWGLKSLGEYLAVGGYPECVLKPAYARELHALYFESTILRDVAARNGIREIKPLQDLAVLMVSESGKAVSSRKTAQAFGVSQPTFRSFERAFCDAFLLLRVLPFKHSPRQRLVADAKHYTIDTGLQNSVSISGSRDEGRRLENLVAIELYRRGYGLSYFQGENECDFIAASPGRRPLAVQVCATGELPARETEGLAEAMEKTNADGLMLTKTPVEQPLPPKAQARTIEQWLLEK